MKTIIETDKAPKAIGTYSQAVKAGNTVYISGQIPLEPNTMMLVSEDFRMQTEQVFRNLDAICIAAGGSLQNLVKITVYLTNLENFSLINEVMAEFIKQPFPARAAIQVSALPRDAQVEIDGVMVL